MSEENKQVENQEIENPAMRAISDEEWNNPKPLEGKDLELHKQNIHHAKKMLMSFVIAKIGILTLIAVVLWKFFGHHKH